MVDPERFTLTFDDQGNAQDPTEQYLVLYALKTADPPVTDLWVFSYGWNTDPTDGSGVAVYDEWVSNMWGEVQKVQAQDPSYHPLFVEVFWPSKAWVGEVSQPSISPPAAPGNAVGAAPQPGAPPAPDPSDFIESYRSVMDPEGNFGEQFDTDFGRIYELLHLPQTPTSAEIGEFVQTLEKYIVQDPHLNQTEEDNVLSAPIGEIVHYLKAGPLPKLQEATTPPVPAAAPGAAPNFIFDNLLNFLRLFTFWTMKARSAVVGANGLYPFLAAVRNTLSTNDPPLHVRIHLLGHSFGGKLVTSAVYSATEQDPRPFVDTLILLQGAFSQFSFTSNIPVDTGASGRYHSVVTGNLVANPLMAIYSQYDLANKLFYPIGMLPVFTGIYEVPPPPPGQPFVSNDKYGSIGSNGTQGVDDPAVPHTVAIPKLDDPEYDWHSFKANGVHCVNVDGSGVIKDGSFPVGAHNDFNHPEIFHLALAFSRQT